MTYCLTAVGSVTSLLFCFIYFKPTVRIDPFFPRGKFGSVSFNESQNINLRIGLLHVK